MPKRQKRVVCLGLSDTALPADLEAPICLLLDAIVDGSLLLVSDLSHELASLAAQVSKLGTLLAQRGLSADSLEVVHAAFDGHSLVNPCGFADLCISTLPGLRTLQLGPDSWRCDELGQLTHSPGGHKLELAVLLSPGCSASMEARCQLGWGLPSPDSVPPPDSIQLLAVGSSGGGGPVGGCSGDGHSKDGCKGSVGKAKGQRPHAGEYGWGMRLLESLKLSSGPALSTHPGVHPSPLSRANLSELSMSMPMLRSLEVCGTFPMYEDLSALGLLTGLQTLCMRHYPHAAAVTVTEPGVSVEGDVHQSRVMVCTHPVGPLLPLCCLPPHLHTLSLEGFELQGAVAAAATEREPQHSTNCSPSQLRSLSLCACTGPPFSVAFDQCRQLQFLFYEPGEGQHEEPFWGTSVPETPDMGVSSRGALSMGVAGMRVAGMRVAGMKTSVMEAPDCVAFGSVAFPSLELVELRYSDTHALSKDLSGALQFLSQLCQAHETQTASALRSITVGVGSDFLPSSTPTHDAVSLRAAASDQLLRHQLLRSFFASSTASSTVTAAHTAAGQAPCQVVCRVETCSPVHGWGFQMLVSMLPTGLSEKGLAMAADQLDTAMATDQQDTAMASDQQDLAMATDQHDTSELPEQAVMIELGDYEDAWTGWGREEDDGARLQQLLHVGLLTEAANAHSLGGDDASELWRPAASCMGGMQQRRTLTPSLFDSPNFVNKLDEVSAAESEGAREASDLAVAAARKVRLGDGERIASERVAPWEREGHGESSCSDQGAPWGPTGGRHAQRHEEGNAALLLEGMAEASADMRTADDPGGDTGASTSVLHPLLDSSTGELKAGTSTLQQPCKKKVLQNAGNSRLDSTSDPTRDTHLSAGVSMGPLGRIPFVDEVGIPKLCSLDEVEAAAFLDLLMIE